MRFSALVLSVGAAALPSLDANLLPRASCGGNTASTRSEWCDYSIDTDYTSVSPDTGVTREYWLELTDVTVAPDGFSRSAMAVNGTIPGPTIYADWGDEVVVHVTNKLTTSQNGTSIHWHGIRQNFTNANDGVTSITQCPTAVGDTTTYTWKAEQYGTTWYHSHFALQAWEGILGGIVINGPATADYDEDVGTIMLLDWSHQTVDELYDYAQSVGPPQLQNGLINGTNTWEDGGARFNMSFESGTSYRLRLINGALDTHFQFSIDNHTLQVIAADLNPIVPYETNNLNIGIGQRYDVIVTADQADVADNFWMRAVPQSECSDNASQDNIRGIVTYVDTPSAPETTGYNYTTFCSDETSNIVPYISKTVEAADFSTSEDVDIVPVGSVFKWTMNSSTLLVDWDYPTLQKVMDGVVEFNASNNVIELPTANEWFYLAIQNLNNAPHPIHLHGHDFFVLAQDTGTYDSSVALNLDNPPRRDTSMMPATGYLVIAFQADNPGAWLMHCHIGWHTSEGFALQFVERYDEIVDTMSDDDQSRLTDTCDTWTSFLTATSIEQDDSGV